MAPIEDLKFKEHTHHTDSIKWFIDKYGNEN